jgi:hypothetical protein
MLLGRNCSLVRVERRAPVEISKSISISLYFAPALRIPIAIPLWYGDNWYPGSLFPVMEPRGMR